MDEMTKSKISALVADALTSAEATPAPAAAPTDDEAPRWARRLTERLDALESRSASGAEPRPAPKGPPVTGGGSPASTAMRLEDRNPLEWSREDIDRIRAERGVSKGNRYVRERLEAYLKNVKVVPPSRRG